MQSKTLTLHFADDTSLICQNKSLKALNKKINQDLSNLTEWLRANKISLNASKTEIILFRNKTKVIKRNLNFRLSGQKLRLSNSVSYLGVDIDEQLSWNIQLSKLTKKLSRSVGILSKLRHLCYKTLISVCVIVIARDRVQYEIYFPSSDIFVSLFSEPSGEENKNKNIRTGKIYSYCTSNMR